MLFLTITWDDVTYFFSPEECNEGESSYDVPAAVNMRHSLWLGQLVNSATKPEAWRPVKVRRSSVKRWIGKRGNQVIKYSFD